MDKYIHRKRLIDEIMALTNPDVGSYFFFENLLFDRRSMLLTIYGYFLPQIEQSNKGGYRVCITFPHDFPLRAPILKELPPFIESNRPLLWTIDQHLPQWIEKHVKAIEEQLENKMLPQRSAINSQTILDVLQDYFESFATN